MNTHLNECGNTIVECPLCQKSMQRALFVYHFENQCLDVGQFIVPTSPSNQQSNEKPTQSDTIEKNYIENGHSIQTDTSNSSQEDSLQATSQSGLLFHSLTKITNLFRLNKSF